MNGGNFNTISELLDFKKNLNISSENLLIQYLTKIYTNLTQREPSFSNKTLNYKKLPNDFNSLSAIKKSLLSPRNLLPKIIIDTGINSKIFLEYMDLQEFIGERLFKYFNKSKTNLLSKSEFIEGLNNLYYGDISSLIKLSFFLCDFNEDGKIYKSDMRLLLVYIPSSSEILQKMKIKQIDKILNSFFEENIKNNEKDKEKEIDLFTYTKFINEYNNNNKDKDKKDNINIDLINEFNNNGPFFYFISILSYLFYNCPFNIKNINYFDLYQKKIKLVLRNTQLREINPKNILMTSIKKGITSESIKEMDILKTTSKERMLLEATAKIGKQNLFQRKRSCSQKIILGKNNNDKSTKQLMNIRKNSIKKKDFIVAIEKEEKKYIHMKNEISMFKKKLKNNPNGISPLLHGNYLNDFSYSKNNIDGDGLNESQKININDFKDLRHNLKLKLATINKEKIVPLSVPLKFKKEDKNVKIPSDFILCDDIPGNENIQKNFEDKNNDFIATYCYKANEERNNMINPKVINKFYCVLSEKELLFFNNDSKTELCDLWFIYKTHISIGKEIINNTTYFTININFFSSNSVNKLYFIKEADCTSFAKKIKKAIHDLNFEDFYELKEELGYGSFAKVCKCKSKNSGKLYAIKIINKSNLKKDDLELIFKERSYLNLIKHPNIIGLKDYFEDKKNIYFITNLCSGGDLLTYIEKNKNISEKDAARIIHKIAEGIKYLNIFGIVHRDIKPENILLSEPNDIKSLKIIDLGVCQTLTYGQMADDPIGTNGYISPEIYLGKNYSFKTDIWSLGIILYELITHGILPFEQANVDNKTMEKKVIYLYQEYPEEYFGKCSKALIILLDKMLDKNFEKRIDINCLLKDSWFNIIKKKG